MRSVTILEALEGVAAGRAYVPGLLYLTSQTGYVVLSHGNGGRMRQRTISHKLLKRIAMGDSRLCDSSKLDDNFTLKLYLTTEGEQELARLRDKKKGHE